MNHTKGPWTAIKYQNTSYYKVAQDFKKYGIDAKDLAGCESDLRYHDAHLIAAAPEMLEKLISLVNSCSLDSTQDLELRKLIRKAMGDL
jgi:hypothetical protein